MAESTVSGPFRSENGFQQLDENGVWVPVTGGGGGGGGSTPASVVVVPSGGGVGSVTLPAPTSVGQIYTVSSKWPDNSFPNGTLRINITSPTVYPVSGIGLLISDSGNSPFSVSSPLNMPVAGMTFCIVQIVYVGQFNYGSTYEFFNVIATYSGT